MSPRWRGSNRTSSANVSHDLKTPLALIRMFGETLEMNRAPDEATRREYYGVITRETQAAVPPDRQCPGFLPHRGRPPALRRRSPSPLEPLVQEVLEAFRYPLAQLGFKVDVEIEPDLPDVPLDAAALKQALANLVDNAIKYSEERRRLAGVGAPARGRGRPRKSPTRASASPPSRPSESSRSSIVSDAVRPRAGGGAGSGWPWSSTSWKRTGAASAWRAALEIGSRFTLHLPAGGKSSCGV